MGNLSEHDNELLTFKICLEHDYQLVNIDDITFILRQIKRGVPQNIILDILLVLILINNMDLSASQQTAAMFADNTYFFLKENKSNLRILFETMNNQLKMTHRWFQANNQLKMTHRWFQANNQLKMTHRWFQANNQLKMTHRWFQANNQLKMTHRWFQANNQLKRTHRWFQANNQLKNDTSMVSSKKYLLKYW